MDAAADKAIEFEIVSVVAASARRMWRWTSIVEGGNVRHGNYHDCPLQKLHLTFKVVSQFANGSKFRGWSRWRHDTQNLPHHRTLRRRSLKGLWAQGRNEKEEYWARGP